jgi:DNA-binding transcriptional MerR regulator
MNQFTISDIEALSGIKAQTLRVWEQRYGLLIPDRKDSKHRIYNNEDLKQILCIAHLNKRGYKISRIANMTKEEIALLALKKDLSEKSFELIVDQFLEACLNFDEALFNKIYANTYRQLSFEDIIIQIFYPLLNKIGKGWMTDHVCPAQEHFCSELITGKIDYEIQKYKPNKKGPLTILFLPRGEYHRLPLLFIMYMMRKNGRRVVYLGSDVAIDTLQEYIAKNNVAVIHLHLITGYFEDQPEIYIEKLLRKFKDQQILISGPVSANIEIVNKRLTLLPSMQSLLHYISS